MKRVYGIVKIAVSGEQTAFNVMRIALCILTVLCSLLSKNYVNLFYENIVMKKVV